MLDYATNAEYAQDAEWETGYFAGHDQGYSDRLRHRQQNPKAMGTRTAEERGYATGYAAGVQIAEVELATLAARDIEPEFIDGLCHEYKENACHT